MQVTLDLPKEVLTAIANDLSTLIRETEDTLAMLRQNRKSIEDALSPVRRTTVTSDTNPYRSYVVTRTALELGGYIYECSCPSYQYERGLDELHQCKHIRTAQGEGF